MAANSENDKIAIIIMSCVFGLTWIWFIFFYVKSTKKGPVRQRKAGRTFNRDNKKTTRSRGMVSRVDTMYMRGKELYEDTLSEGLCQSAMDSVLRPYKSGCCFLFYILSMTICERFDDILKKKHNNEDVSEELKQLGLHVSFAEGTLNELMDSIDEDSGEDDLEVIIEELQEIGGRLATLASDLDVKDRIDWSPNSPPFDALCAKIKSRTGFTKMAKMPVEEDEDDEDAQQGWCGRTMSRLYSFFFRGHPYFYFMFWGLWFSIVMSHWVFIGSGKLRPGTFLSTPPQYSLGNSTIQDIMLPIVFGLMHSSLYLFGLIPVCFTRGLHRDLQKIFIGLRQYIPFDDMFFFHQLVGTMLIGCLFAASNVWLIMMGYSCMGDDNQAVSDAACKAFNPNIFDAKKGGEILFDSLPGASYFDPRDNVLFLREIVWLTWFFVMPLLYWRARPNEKLPAIVKKYWWEIVYYLHLVGAIASILLALYARFEVFYPMLAGGWSFWFIDKTREALFKTYSTDMLVDAQRPTTSSYNITAASGQPTVVCCRFAKPKGMDHGKGQWLYLQVPEISRVWHPFSLASSSDCPHVELLVGIQGKWTLKKNGEWIQPKARETWTHQLLQVFRSHARESLRLRQPRPVRVKLRGPYGSPFQKCFDQRYPAVIIIGAGTGLTSAMSVLKEMVALRKKGKSKQLVWFVWACQRVSDLLMCWRSLHDLLFEASRNGSLAIDDDWNPMTSVMLDWLSITIYVTKADKNELIKFLDNSMAMAPTKMFAGLAKQKSQETLGKEASPFKAMMRGLGEAKEARQSIKKTDGNETTAGAFQAMLTKLRAANNANPIAEEVEEPQWDPVVPPPPAPPTPTTQPKTAKPAAPATKSLKVPEPLASGRFNRFGSFFSSTKSQRRAKKPAYNAPPAFDNDSSDDESVADDEEARVGSRTKLAGAAKLRGAAGRWQKACQRAQETHAVLETGSSSLDNENLGQPGDFLIRRGAEDDLVLVILCDARSNTFEFHSLRNTPGGFTIDGKAPEKQCLTLEELIKHLQVVPDNVTTTLRGHTDPASRAYMERAVGEWLHINKDEIQKLDIIPFMKAPTDRELTRNPTKDISTWMKEQVLATSMDNKGANIALLFQWVRAYVADPANNVPGGADAPIAISFCGPAALATMLGKASAKMGGTVEYSSEHI